LCSEFLLQSMAWDRARICMYDPTLYVDVPHYFCFVRAALSRLFVT